MICTHLNHRPSIAEDVFIAPGSVVIGDITIGSESSIWYQTVLRGDIESIVIGEGSNIQDGTVIHLASDIGTQVGDYVTVGHKALLHACTIHDEVLIGMGSIVMDGAVVGSQSIVGAGALITKGMEIPEGSLVVGSPAKVLRPLTVEEREGIKNWAFKYIEVAKEHQLHLTK